MEVNSFVDTMKKILRKAEEDSGLCLDWHLVSGDPSLTGSSNIFVN